MKVPLTGKLTAIYESDNMKFRFLEFMGMTLKTVRDVHVIELMRKKYSIMDNENFYLNITKEEKRFLYNRERTWNSSECTTTITADAYTQTSSTS